ncbi:MAG: peptidyl-dipeptidase Dcp, partial [Acidobacteriaceae bacterium]|nr:peptidyl-dipeptidase Dcp [Acidobacteriaceae bacterium]
MRPEIHYVANADAGAIAVTSSTTSGSDGVFGPGNPFYTPSSLPFQAPPFDRIQDSDYQPAIEAGMAQQLAEIHAIADSPAGFENTLVALEKSGRLLDRVMSVFDAVTSANTNPDLQRVQQIEAPKLA